MHLSVVEDKNHFLVHPVLHYTGVIHEKVRVDRTVQLVDETLIHVHDHCSLGLLFRKRTAHFYEKPANSGLPLLVEGGDFDSRRRL